jgi:hypothetical protein
VVTVWVRARPAPLETVGDATDNGRAQRSHHPAVTGCEDGVEEQEALQDIRRRSVASVLREAARTDVLKEEAWDRVRQDHDGTVTFGIAYVKIDDIVTILDELEQALSAHR